MMFCGKDKKKDGFSVQNLPIEIFKLQTGNSRSKSMGMNLY